MLGKLKLKSNWDMGIIREREFLEHGIILGNVQIILLSLIINLDIDFKAFDFPIVSKPINQMGCFQDEHGASSGQSPYLPLAGDLRLWEIDIIINF